MGDQVKVHIIIMEWRGNINHVIKDISLDIKKNREGYEMWRYILWFLSILLIIEMLISNFIKKKEA